MSASILTSVLRRDSNTVADGIDVATVADLISNERRRHVCSYAARELGSDEAATLGEIAEHVAAVEHGVDYDSGERKSVYITLYQCHIDDLVDAGVLERTEQDKLYRAGPNAEPVAGIVSHIESVVGGED